MENQPLHIKFENQQRPRAGFDMLPLKSVFTRTDLDHDPTEYHLVEFYILIIVAQGTGSHCIDFKPYPYKKGTVFTIRKDQIHKFVANPEVSGTLLLFTNEFLVSYLEKLESQRTLQLFNELLGAPLLQLNLQEYQDTLAQLQRLEREYFEVGDAYSLNIIRSELQILIARLFRIKSRHETALSSVPRLNDFIRFQNLAEANITKKNKVSDYSKLLGASTKTLNKLTKSTVHKTAKEFLDEIHLKQIKRLLINSKNSIKEIAYQSGFEEPTNFYKFFKRHTQVTPEQFRSLQR